MKQIGNLAVVCAQRSDVLLQIQGQNVSLYVDCGPQRKHISVTWDDDKMICNIVHELNYGKYAADRKNELSIEPQEKEGEE